MQNDNSIVKIVVFVPIDTADEVRLAMAEAGAGVIGNYTRCSFSTRGQGRFLPGSGAHPAVGQIDQLETVEEERIETVCSREKLQTVIDAIKSAHPYEEVALDVYPLESI